MTIDEHIGVIEDLKSTMSVCMPDPEKTEICASLNEAINTMRKYQKVQHIVKYDWGKGYQLSETFNRINEVIKDSER